MRQFAAAWIGPGAKNSAFLGVWLLLSGCIIPTEEYLQSQAQLALRAERRRDDQRFSQAMSNRHYGLALTIAQECLGDPANGPRRTEELKDREHRARLFLVAQLVGEGDRVYRDGALTAALKRYRSAQQLSPYLDQTLAENMRRAQEDFAHCEQQRKQADWYVETRQWQKAKEVLEGPVFTRFAKTFTDLDARFRTVLMGLAAELTADASRALANQDLQGARQKVQRCQVDCARSPDAWATCSVLDEQILSREQQRAALDASAKGDSEAALAHAQQALAHYQEPSATEVFNKASRERANLLGKQAAQSATKGRWSMAHLQYLEAAKLAPSPKHHDELAAKAGGQRSEVAGKLYQLAMRLRSQLPGATVTLLKMAQDLAGTGPPASKVQKEPLPLPDLNPLLHRNSYNVEVSVSIDGQERADLADKWVAALRSELRLQSGATRVNLSQSLSGSHPQATLKLELPVAQVNEPEKQEPTIETHRVYYDRPKKSRNKAWDELEQEYRSFADRVEQLQSEAGLTRDSVSRLAGRLDQQNLPSLERRSVQAFTNGNIHYLRARAYERSAEEHRERAKIVEEASARAHMNEASRLERLAAAERADARAKIQEGQQVQEQLNLVKTLQRDLADEKQKLRRNTSTLADWKSRLVKNEMKWKAEPEWIKDYDRHVLCEYLVKRRTSSVAFEQAVITLTDERTLTSYVLKKDLGRQVVEYNYYPDSKTEIKCAAGERWDQDKVLVLVEPLPKSSPGKSQLVENLLGNQLAAYNKELGQKLHYHGDFLVEAAKAQTGLKQLHLWTLVLQAAELLSQPQSSLADAKQALREFGWDVEKQHAEVTPHLDDLFVGARHAL